MIRFVQKGDFGKTNKFFERLLEFGKMSNFDKYGKMGVNALAAATPQDTGKTANSWRYTIEHEGNNVIIGWENTNINDGCNIAVILQYGHGTGWGGYVQGQDYINPAIRPVFEEIAETAWKELIKA